MAGGAWLLFALAAVVVFIIYTTASVRMHAFLALILASFIMGLLAKMPLLTIVDSITAGFGSTVSSIGIVIALGAAMGTILEKSGAAETMARTMLRLVGRARAALAMALTGYVVSIPVFCDSGFVILSPLNKALAAATRTSLTTMAIALSMGLYSTHTLVPPTPGPIAAAGTIGADLGRVIVYGVLAAFPAMLAGWWFAEKVASRYSVAVADEPGVTLKDAYVDEKGLPSPAKSFAPIIVPVILILLKSVADLPSAPLGRAGWKTLFDFIGHPVTALLIGTFLALLTVPRLSREVWSDWIGAGVATAGWIILITAAGGALGNVIRATPLASYLGATLGKWHMGILLPFLVSAALKTAQGSSTVALITTSALMAPLLTPMGLGGETAKALVVLAIGAGSMVVSHANDSYFWVVTQLSGMDVPTGYKCQTVSSLITGVTALVAIVVMSWVFM
ncbi:MAG: GntP family permease [Firmicutes bacterium]|jgi:GntP family gluconate:H+ symporter|nr:GntP family permease [Bacillota bacterium]MDH7495611.1 GntP family permease [Bacillota bacterium]